MAKKLDIFERVVIPDTHGSSIDVAARDAFLADLKDINPREIVMLGDHVDCDAPFKEHQSQFLAENTYTYDEDILAAVEFLDAIQLAAPKARLFYLEGNHEQHVERYVARYVDSKLAERMLKDQAPQFRLDLQGRGITYYRMSEHYHGLGAAGAIRLGKCCFTHGSKFSSKFATAQVLQKFNYNVVHGHTHRAAEATISTARDESLGAWNPGCLCEKRPLWNQPAVNDWTHGYGLQYVFPNGNFQHINAKIVNGVSLMPEAVRRAA